MPWRHGVGRRLGPHGASLKWNHHEDPRIASRSLHRSRRRRALLIAALACTRVQTTAPEVAMVCRWLDTWSGTGAVIVGMIRQGYLFLQLRSFQCVDLLVVKGDQAALFFLRPCVADKCRPK